MKFIVLLLLLGCSKHETEKSYLPATVEKPPQEHSFELVQLGSMRRDQFLLDKKTGELWSSSCWVGGNGPDCSYLAWTKMDVEDLNGVTFQSIYEKADRMEQSRKKKSK